MTIEDWANVAKIIGALTGAFAALTWLYKGARRPWSVEEDEWVYWTTKTREQEKRRKSSRRENKSSRPKKSKIKYAEPPPPHRSVWRFIKRQVFQKSWRWVKRWVFAIPWRWMKLKVLEKRQSSWAQGAIWLAQEDASGHCAYCPPQGLVVQHLPVRWQRPALAEPFFWPAAWMHFHFFPGKATDRPKVIEPPMGKSPVDKSPVDESPVDALQAGEPAARPAASPGVTAA